FLLVEEIRRLHLPRTEQLLRLVVEMLRVGVVALTQREQRPRARRLAQLDHLRRGLAGTAEIGFAVLYRVEADGPRRGQTRQRAAADRPGLAATLAADAVNLAERHLQPAPVLLQFLRPRGQGLKQLRVGDVVRRGPTGPV